mmetsp:Transcript_10477/g.32014  ORF Transcript_10477/g.32014 Transcript_10477/m.32014 type:complete len:225 (-) Transcript_10477:397-1071(-)
MPLRWYGPEPGPVNIWKPTWSEYTSIFLPLDGWRTVIISCKSLCSEPMKKWSNPSARSSLMSLPFSWWNSSPRVSKLPVGMRSSSTHMILSTLYLTAWVSRTFSVPAESDQYEWLVMLIGVGWSRPVASYLHVTLSWVRVYVALANTAPGNPISPVGEVRLKTTSMLLESLRPTFSMAHTKESQPFSPPCSACLADVVILCTSPLSSKVAFLMRLVTRPMDAPR